MKILENDESTAVSLDRWKTHLEKFGLGNYLGYDLPIGKRGLTLVTTMTVEGRWGPTTVISNAIGQGDLGHPIQMANFTAVVQ